MKNADKTNIEQILQELSKDYLTTYKGQYVERTVTDWSDSWGPSFDTYKYLFTYPLNEIFAEITSAKQKFCDLESKSVEIDFEIRNSIISTGGYIEGYECNFAEYIDPSTEYLTLKFAKAVADEFHKGQKRKKNGLPYITHLEEVANSVKSEGHFVESIAWLHDIVEDTPLTIAHIKKYFGSEIAEGVNVLTRNVNRIEYKKRLLGAPEYIQLIKLYDIQHNVETIENLSEGGIKRKVEDCINFYIPLALKLEKEEIASALFKSIDHYLF
ncbi:MAG: HD domain-containing protein [Nanoarchaeota archaeon]|nr:HD domain-containing protein [Nanoarchaeota archaeon]